VQEPTGEVPPDNASYSKVGTSRENCPRSLKGVVHLLMILQTPFSAYIPFMPIMGTCGATTSYFNNVNTAKVDRARLCISGFALEQPTPRADDTIRPSLGGDNLYRHPNHQGSHPTFDPVFDVYSLGVVLTEVAYWKPICEVLRVDPTERYNPKFTRKVRGLLLQESQHAALSGIVGNGYAELVRMCLMGPEESFHDALVEKLKGIYRDV
jgi:hypothetical protein